MRRGNQVLSKLNQATVPAGLSHDPPPYIFNSPLTTYALLITSGKTHREVHHAGIMGTASMGNGALLHGN